MRDAHGIVSFVAWQPRVRVPPCGDRPQSRRRKPRRPPTKREPASGSRPFDAPLRTPAPRIPGHRRRQRGRRDRRPIRQHPRLPRTHARPTPPRRKRPRRVAENVAIRRLSPTFVGVRARTCVPLTCGDGPRRTHLNGLPRPGGQGVAGSNPVSPTHRRRSGPCAGSPVAVAATHVAIHVAMRRGSPPSGTVRPSSFGFHSGRRRTRADGCGPVGASCRGQGVTPFRVPATGTKSLCSGGCAAADQGSTRHVRSTDLG